MNTIYITTSIRLTKEQKKFFDKKRIKMSPFIRDFIDDSEEYREWKKHGKSL